MVDWKHAKHFLIYGYAREGHSSLRYLRRTLPRVSFDIHDNKLSKYGGVVDFTMYDCIVVSSGISRDVIPAQYRKICINIVELFFDSLTSAAREKVIGVSGTKGKSTTVSFITACLQEAGLRAVSAGNIGVPVLDVLPDLLAGKLDYVVLELSSFQLEFLRMSPKYAIFLNLFPDHLDRHRTMEKYLRAKSHLWVHQKFGDVLFVPKRWKSMVSSVSAKDIEIRSTVSAPKAFFSQRSIFQAAHWRANFGTAFALLKQLGIPARAIQKTARQFVGLPHRLELFATRKGISFYDDSIAVNVDATMAAAKFLQKRLGSIILGGYDRGQDFSGLIHFLVGNKAYIIVLDTPVAERILFCMRAMRYERYVVVKTLRQAVHAAYTHTVKGKISLLSCAAPSFGLFKNFEERGNQFKKLVNDYSA